MKTSFRITALFLIMSCALSTATVQAAQYYVVIGSFEDESNARKFTGAVRQSFHDVSYTFNQSKKLYYVHVLRTSRKEEARKWSLYLRREKRFQGCLGADGSGTGGSAGYHSQSPEAEVSKLFCVGLPCIHVRLSGTRIISAEKIDAGITAARIVIAGICGCGAGNPSRIRRIERRRLVDCSG